MIMAVPSASFFAAQNVAIDVIANIKNLIAGYAKRSLKSCRLPPSYTRHLSSGKLADFVASPSRSNDMRAHGMFGIPFAASAHSQNLPAKKWEA